jgi:hypothetical protein
MIVNAIYPNIWRIIARAITQMPNQYGGRIYYNVAPPEPVYPYLVYQSDSSFGAAYGLLNMSAWKGLVTMRSVSTTYSGSIDTLSEISNYFNNTYTVSGIPHITIPYDVQFYPYKTYSFPVERLNNIPVYTSAVGVETFITPKN